MSENKLTTAIVRSAYLFAMYTGIRAVANCVLSLFLPVPRAAVIDGAIIQLDETVSIKVRVHGKIRPSTTDATRVGGMISVYLVHPGIRRSLYSLLRVSSHFGCGHIELAFYEDDCTVCVFAVRNILRSNLDRIGCNEPVHTEPRAARSLNQPCSPQPGESRRSLNENSLLQFAFEVFTSMMCRPKTFLLQLFLVTTAFGLITTYDEHRYGLFAYIAVSALYSAGFALYLSRSASTRNGIAGAVLGFAIALLVGVVPDFCCYVVPGGVEPTFDGDGPLIGLAVLPLFAFFYLLIPTVMLGGFIGWTSSSSRSVTWSPDASAT